MVVVFASGQGTTFEALVHAYPNLEQYLICNVNHAGALKIAQKNHIPYEVIDHKIFKSRKDHEQAIILKLSQLQNIKLILLAGYMRVLSNYFFEQVEKLNLPQIINLHPAHLDQYKGAHGYEFALEHKFPRWGLSIHKVTPVLDSGELVACTEFPILPYYSLETIKEIGKKLEHKLLISTIKNWIL